MFTSLTWRIIMFMRILENLQDHAWNLPCINHRLFEPLSQALYIKRSLAHVDRE
jgi:hypothetical protein